MQEAIHQKWLPRTWGQVEACMSRSLFPDMTPGSKVQGPRSRIQRMGMPAVWHSAFFTISAGRATISRDTVNHLGCGPSHLLFFSLPTSYMLCFSQQLKLILNPCSCSALFPITAESIYFQIRKSSCIPSSTHSELPFLIPPVWCYHKRNCPCPYHLVTSPNQAVGYLLNSHLEDEWAFGIYFKIFKNHFTVFFFY